MQPPNRLAEHAWLERLVGDWTVSSKTVGEPGAEPMLYESRESIRSIGGLWIVSEGSAEYEGEPFTSLMTLGFDPVREAFIGSWIDTLQTTQWTYVGRLDEARRMLTLEAQGPSFLDPSRTARYRDQLEWIAPDHKRMRSSILGEDGSWTNFMTADARRVK